MSDEHPYRWAVDIAPVGVWRTHAGSLDQLGGTTLTLSKYGSRQVAVIRRISPDERVPLVWRYDGTGSLRLYARFDEGEAVPQDESEWDVFDFRAAWRDVDGRRIPVLVNATVTDGWYKRGGFWTLQDPIVLVARA